MKPTRICKIKGKLVPVPGANMDTDRIIPARFLKCITFDELAGKMFYDERFNADGSPKGHPIDAPQYAGSTILIGGENFGCGSSREHAPQAILRSGLPCVCASPNDLAEIRQQITRHPETVWTLDLETMQLSAGTENHPVRMPEEPREAFLQGRWDSVAELLKSREAVEEKASTLPCPHTVY